MRLLFVGDVVGRSGRSVLLEHGAGLRRDLALDALIVNGENAAGGFGLTPAIAREFFDAGVDVITMGNHVWDQKELIGYIDREPRIVRPLNMRPGTPGRGIVEITTARGHKIVVVQVIGRLFMGMQDDAFAALEAALRRHVLGGTCAAIVVDVHAEATSEKAAIGLFLDGSVSLVVGTHTHIPTADERILPGGTAYMTDVGMTGDYQSVIGMEAEGAIHRWRSSLPGPRLQAAMGEATLCAVYVELDDRSGLARLVRPLRIGGGLVSTAPSPEADGRARSTSAT
ncbi:MAG: YmdB family metallophosphoesterase [Geminicoccaceae bacterium]|nr:YmdB family metallophosphoesterase [Geminicoccaceae bacterium]